MQKGFFASLFDLSFTSFVTTKIVKVIYVLSLVAIALLALLFVLAAFQQSAAAGVLALIVGAPLFFLLYAVVVRVGLEFIVQVFRIGEMLRDQSELQRRAFGAAGWLPATDPQPAQATGAAAACPSCGAIPSTPGATFCRSCGSSLVG